MRTQTIKLYTIDELSEEAQQTAIENWRAAGPECAWTEEWRDSLDRFAGLLGITVKDWQVNLCGPSDINWEYHLYDCDLTDLKGLRLRTWLINNWMPWLEQPKYLGHGKGEYSEPDLYHPMIRWHHVAAGPNAGECYRFYHSRIQMTAANCPLTGFFGDMALIDPILQFIQAPDDRDLEDLIGDCLHQWIKEFTADLEEQNSDEYILDHLQANEYEFTENGRMQ